MRYEYVRKPEKCPSCGSDKIAGILYGFPEYSPELESDLQEGRVVLGGCCVSDDDPEWGCTNCNAVIFRKQEGQY